MIRNSPFFSGSNLRPFRLVLGYVLFSIFWVFFSDPIISFLNHQTSQQLSNYSIIKWSIYIAVNSAVMYWLFRKEMLNTAYQKKVEQLIRINEERLKQIINLVPHYIFARDIEGRFILVNRAMAQAYGTTVEELIGRTDADFARSKEEIRRFRKDDLDVIRSGKSKAIPYEIITSANGESRILSTTKIPFLASGVDLPCVLGVSVDVTEHKNSQKALQESQHFIEGILNATPSLIYIYDLINRCNVYCNREILNFMGYTPEQIKEMGSSLLENVVHPEDLVRLEEHHKRFVKEGDVREIDYRVKDIDGHWRWLRSRDVLFTRTVDGKPWQILGSAEDITERRYLQDRLLTLAHYDALTDFPNRVLFLERANVGLSHARRQNTACAILFVDLDHFKSINDTLGHSIGDALLKDTALKISECVREMDTIARLGGDEFIVFLNGLEGAESARHIAERIREKFNCPRQVLGNDLFVTASVGIATFPNDGNDLEDLLKNADTAMYAAKDAGRNGYCFFDSLMNQKAVVRMKIERGLRDAIAKSQLKLFYQPVVRARDHKVRGFEALLRWYAHDEILMYPAQFISIAEERGLINPIGEWVLKEACHFAKKINSMSCEEKVISVNISVAQLRRKGIVNIIRNALKESALSASCLEIEVTESILVDSLEDFIHTLKQIRSMGVKVSLDDFGTGYSSLSYLQRLPIDNLKIDRLFVKELMKKGVETALTSTIIDLAHTLKLNVIAEGVEHDLQLKRLVEDKCDYCQGFLFGKPMPEDVAIDFLQKQADVFKIITRLK